MKIIACNLKMNLMPSEVPKYLEDMQGIKNEVLMFPPSIYIDNFVKAGFTTGSQDIGIAEKGAYTGDISITQLKELGIKYSIVGHSERRTYHIDDRFVNKKIELCIENGIYPILCVGETHEENISGDTLKICYKEIDSAFIDNEIKDLIISYEPIWSIGTGIIPSNEFIEDIASNIKKYVYNKYGLEVRVLYGGSVSDENIEKLEKIESIDGYLIGGCSLSPESMKKIVHTVRGF